MYNLDSWQLLSLSNGYKLFSHMLFKPLPQNLDAYVVQDHLFQTLKKNKFTQQLLNLRAEEIVKGLLK